ncbi:MAG: hypothetical protein AAB863_03950 [Patescibacteria group bacterium]
MKFFKKIIIVSSLLLPVVSSAAPLDKTKEIFRALGNIIGLLIPIVFALALLLFFWGIAKYIFKSGEEKDNGKNIMVWGVVALFVMSSIWGLVKFINISLGIGGASGEAPTNQRVPTLGQ